MHERLVSGVPVDVQVAGGWQRGLESGEPLPRSVHSGRRAVFRRLSEAQLSTSKRNSFCQEFPSASDRTPRTQDRLDAGSDGFVLLP
jgi:hypothetical protein